ncbi:MAG: polyprenyl synthetase family protein [Planctomycetota bacterium]
MNTRTAIRRRDPSALADAKASGGASSLALRVQAAVGPELAAVEDMFDNELASDIASVRTLVKHVERFRGKMLRPMLTLLTGKACGNLNEDHIVLSAVVEMVHMATLVHDDVLDEAELRRKGATLNHLRGNEAAVLLGDFLISHSYHLCSSLADQSAAREVGACTNRVCEGELLQIHHRSDLDLDEDTYLEIISRKTAALTATCCKLGARHAGASDEVIDALTEYGLLLGIAFQIQDDILDLVGDVREVGKTLGIDVEKQKLTLPMIHFLRTAPAEHRELMRSLLRGAEPDKAERIRNLIAPSDALPYARRRAEHYVKQAMSKLDVLDDGEAKSVLMDIAAFVTKRSV